MKTITYLIMPVFALFGILLSGCGPTAGQIATQTSEAVTVVAAAWTATSTYTPVPTLTPLPTNTLIPTNPPTATNTPTPTNSPTATNSPLVIRPTLTPGMYGGLNGSVYTLGKQMWVVFGRFATMPEMGSNSLLIGKFYIEGDPTGTPVSVLIASQFSIGKYSGSFAGNCVWTGGTSEEFRKLIVVGDLIEMRYPIGFNSDFDKVLGELAKGNWAARSPNNLVLNPAMIGIVLK